MSSDLMIDGISPVAVHEAAHAVVHLAHAGTFRYVTLRPRRKGVRGHVYGVGQVGSAMVMAGPIAQHVYEGTATRLDGIDLVNYMSTDGSCGDFEVFNNITEAGSQHALTISAMELVEGYWEEIMMVAAMLERLRTMTPRQVKTVMDDVRAEGF